ncbi:MAG TPA: serine/threonine-protein kinase [Bryobacteraceae bacterium]|nr:serine/threonine-protein kinase [Bryobacteraceae bacterium]
MQVDPKAWPILNQLLDEWLDLVPEQRAAWLVGVEREHPEILPALREMLAQPKPDFLETLPKIESGAGEGPAAPGALAGPYRLVREIGRGGMGVVWLAERADGNFKRDVALKFPLVYFHNQTLTDRFARERDILARLADARIARLYDAGVTAQGQPYLALEYVEGEPITTYCERLGLDARARLRLFLDVLRAVQYAHANLVVHRDLKPSNILVTNAGQVRLLDFGIAKLLAEGEAEETEITRAGGRALTPDYASPEQTAGGTITTATDVYSLGVLLYELLSGARPSRSKSTEPVRPSQTVAVKKLRAALRGDLDTIVLKAMQPEPQARYSSVDAFAQDIERHLAGQPVLARPESAWYRTKKFVLRNKLVVSSAAAVALALAVGAGVAIWQAERAMEEKRRADIQAATARAVRDFLQNDLLAQAGSEAQAGTGKKSDPDLKVRTALDRAAAHISGKFAAQPAVEAAIRQTMGVTYADLGLYPQAQQQEERAFELRRRVLGPDDPDTLDSMQGLAEICRREGQYDRAEALLTAMMDIEHRLKRDGSPQALIAMHTLASIAVNGRADYKRGEALYSALLETERRVQGEADPGTLATMNNFAAMLVREGKYGQAEELYKKVVALKQRVMGTDHPSTLTTMNGLGVLYLNEGKYPEAETLLQAVFEARRRAMGPEHRDTLSTMNILGRLYMDEGKTSEAERLVTEVVETNRRVLGQDNPDTLASISNLAELYRRENNLKQAEALLQELLETRRRVSGPDSLPTAGVVLALGEVKLQERAYVQAEPLLRQAIADYRKGNSDTWPLYYAECLLGVSLKSLGRGDEAGPMMSAGYQGLLARRDSIPFDRRSILEQVSSH